MEHPQGGNSQKKVQQTHKGLKLFGHSFVVGLAADGVTEVVEGTYGTVVTGLDKAIPHVNPKLTEAQVRAHTHATMFSSCMGISTFSRGHGASLLMHACKHCTLFLLACMCADHKPYHAGARRGHAGPQTLNPCVHVCRP